MRLIYHPLFDEDFSRIAEYYSGLVPGKDVDIKNEIARKLGDLTTLSSMGSFWRAARGEKYSFEV